jgi:hypothetical protein
VTCVFVNFRIVNIISQEDIPFGLGPELFSALMRLLQLELLLTLVLALGLEFLV